MVNFCKSECESDGSDHISDGGAEIPISLDIFLQTSGITDTTAWRWRKKGWLKTSNIAGRVYIFPADLREFNRRAKAGEFAKEHKAPRKVKSEECVCVE
jgi:hypothetical protein